MNRFVAALLSCIVLFLGPVTRVFAQDLPDVNETRAVIYLPVVSSNASPHSVLRVVSLEPNAGASAASAEQLNLSDVTATEFTDGIVQVNVQGNYDANLPALEYRLDIDLAEATYGLEITETLQSTELTSLNVNASAINGTSSARVTMNTKDPALLTLSTTTNFLRWNYNGSTVQWTEANDACWAANPTPWPLNTHWYTTFCSSASPSYFNNNSEVCNWAIADYLNWDFGNINQSTDAHHWIKICGQKSGSYTYATQYWDAGESSSIIFHTVSLN